ncbi:MAG: hypothetical protein ACR2H5_17240 [Ktedonobacteraceae bacterium]
MSIVFLGVEIAFIALILLVFVSNGLGRLESSIGIMSDGIVIGKAAPAWNLPDLQGVLQRTPTHDSWQFLIFAQNCLDFWYHHTCIDTGWKRYTYGKCSARST